VSVQRITTAISSGKTSEVQVATSRAGQALRRCYARLKNAEPAAYTRSAHHAPRARTLTHTHTAVQARPGARPHMRRPAVLDTGGCQPLALLLNEVGHMILALLLLLCHWQTRAVAESRQYGLELIIAPSLSIIRSHNLFMLFLWYTNNKLRFPPQSLQ